MFRQRGAKGKKSERKELGERRVSSPSLPGHKVFFSAAFLFTVPTIWTPGTSFFGARRLGCGRKKERQQNYECLKVTYDQAGFFRIEGEISLTGMLLHLVHFPGIWSSG